MKTINFTSRSKNSPDKLLHIETDFGIVNIRIGLLDAKLRRGTAIEVIPSDYAGEPYIRVDGNRNIRLIEESKP